jgi:Uma2 family endonuclease
MNQYQRPDDFVRERPEPGRPRRWTADELEHMVRAGIVNEIERIELIAGEIVQMSAKGNRHELVRNELTLYWARQLPLKLKFAEEVPLRLSEHDQPEPDIMLFPGSQNITQVTAASVLLVVEVSDSSLSYDLKIKAPLYAAFGVREYWVIDPQTLATTVHRAPGEKGYADVTKATASDLLTPLHAPELALRLADLGIEPEAEALAT